MPGDARLNPLEEDLLAALDPGELPRHLARLAEPGRGTGEARQRDRAAAYVRATVRGWGLPLTLHRFDALISAPREASLSLARRDAPVAAMAHPYSSSTPASGLVGELRLAGANEDLAGCIALVDGAPTPAGVAAVAAEGAVAQVYISPDEALRPVPVAAAGATIATPVISIGRGDGEGFLALCAGGPTPVQVRATVEWGRRRLALPVATIAGVEEPDTFVLVGAGLGEDDPGAAVLLELCRVLAQGAGRLRRGLRLAWWPGGTAPAAAAAWYAGQAWADLARGAVAYVGLGGAAEQAGGTTFGASPSLRWFGEDTLGDGGAPRARWLGAAPGAEAAPFAGLGLPFLNVDSLAALGEDAGRDLAGLARRASLHVLLLARLCVYPLLPLDAPALARAIEGRLRERLAAGEVGGEPAALAPLPDRAAAFRAAADRVQLAAVHVAQAESPSYEEAVEQVNRVLRRLNRLLVPLLHRTGDRYTSAPISPTLLPGLETPLAHPGLVGDNAAGHRLRAGLVRERNRLADALGEAIAACEEALVALRALGLG